MYYTIYKITNNINGKIYIGSHKTKNIDDKYMGSGKYLKRAIEKDGIENFTKEILFVFDNPEDMYAKEAELVNEDFISNENTYNLKVGGFGGFDYINNNRHLIKNLNFRDLEVQKKKGKSLSLRIQNFGQTDKEKQSSKEKGRKRSEKYSLGLLTPPFLGKVHSQETKDKIGLKNSINQSGKGNSQFGTVWITDGIKPIKIKKTDNIPEGYIKGRKNQVGN